MKTRVAINGFGRIGRSVFKVLFDRTDVEVVALNDLTDNETLAHLLRYDSNYGSYKHEVESSDDGIKVDGRNIKILSEKDPSKLPWESMKVDVVVECTGIFRSPKQARMHVQAGAKKVVISAPASGDDADDAHTVVIGVNEDTLENHRGDILSNASCTTNCISPVAAVIHSNFGIEKVMMTTIHAYTADQNLQDGPHKDLRRSRAAALNIVPTSTGATKAVGRVIRELEGTFEGMAVRVPVPTGSLSDFTMLLKKDVTVEEVNKALTDAADQPYYQGVLTVTNDPIVSADIVGDSHSAIVDLSLTKVTGGNLLKVVAWYDNEWGYSNRLAELVADIGKKLEDQV
ncbi:MAG: type I glyceraldehyde-3-phosphate dehydrogenase [Candidatus Saccharimonadales bacterium]|nr:type I glyceraldehyde-3-phosphate dehydrogenase [Candidatus Saccharimonadales bacterium]